jgi:23S rRNA pseudouridine955/2504/2580 synthase
MTEVRKEAPAGPPLAVSYARVDEESAGQRLDNFLLRLCKGVPKSHIYRIVRSGEVRVDGHRAEAATRLEAGNEVRIPPIRLAQPDNLQKKPDAAARAGRFAFDVLFEDDALLVINKPAGLAVHGGSGLDFGVIEALRAQRPEARFLELAHRLDRETSGVLLIGKKRSALKVLHDMFRQGAGDKRYLALVSGHWTEKVKDVRLPLEKYLTEDGERRVSVNGDEGRFAHTIVRKVESGRRFSLVEAQIKTGRTHQIRVHLSHLGFPIAGDDKYGDFALNKMLVREGLKRMFLHAWKMRFPHPVSGEMLAVEAVMPAELSRFLDRARLDEAGK